MSAVSLATRLYHRERTPMNDKLSSSEIITDTLSTFDTLRLCPYLTMWIKNDKTVNRGTSNGVLFWIKLFLKLCNEAIDDLCFRLYEWWENVRYVSEDIAYRGICLDICGIEAVLQSCQRFYGGAGSLIHTRCRNQ
ncbi:hypothetical protein KIN20_021615 [Parelaphostrongylus tenuis]|uniref:Uncharacterized protein n=1 Tax=Parelaphostrongylus tenuis TaxID=148309 RepID=A0AAD5N843_PARTN|nr:hypothetical protein KIN20_021615 [Parelaphostrongylus tenuis]